MNAVGMASMIREKAKELKKLKIDAMSTAQFKQMVTGIDNGILDNAIFGLMLGTVLRSLVNANAFDQKKETVSVKEMLDFKLTMGLEETPFLYMQFILRPGVKEYTASMTSSFKSKVATQEGEKSLEKHLKTVAEEQVTFYDKPILGPITDKIMDGLNQKFLLGGEMAIGFNEESRKQLEMTGLTSHYKNRMELWEVQKEGKKHYFFVSVTRGMDFLSIEYCRDKDTQKDTIRNFLLMNEIHFLITPEDEMKKVVDLIKGIGNFKQANSVETKLASAKEELNFEVKPVKDSDLKKLLSEKGTSGNPKLIDEYIWNRIAQKELDETVMESLRESFKKAVGNEQPSFTAGGYLLYWKAA